MILLSWTDFKKFVDDKRITFQWFDRSSKYVMYASDGLLSFSCDLDKTPSDTTDLDDFVNNYKDFQNVPAPQIVTPTSIKNEYVLNPEGMHARRYNPSDWLGEITLTNKSGFTYNFTKTLSAELQKEDALWFFDNDEYFQRVYVEAFEGSSITLSAEIPEGTYKHSRMFRIDYYLNSAINIHYLWAVMFSTLGKGKYDWAGLELYNPMTDELIIKYDECWEDQISKLVRIGSPDGAAGELPAVKCSVEYYHADDDFTGNIVKIDYVTTFKDE